MTSFLRTRHRYSLDEILYVVYRIAAMTPIDQIAQEVQRSPEAIKYKFLEYRAKNKDGTYSQRSVKDYQAME